MQPNVYINTFAPLKMALKQHPIPKWTLYIMAVTLQQSSKNVKLRGKTRSWKTLLGDDLRPIFQHISSV